MISPEENQKIEKAFQKVRFMPLISLFLLAFLLGIVIVGTIPYIYDILAVTMSIVGVSVFASFFWLHNFL